MSQAAVIDVHVDEADLFEHMKDECRVGLLKNPKEIPPKFFYDARGSVLFEQITELPEYYQTRTERKILEDVVGVLETRHRFRQLLEFGSGSSSKTRVLLDAMHESGNLELYLPLDVSESIVRMTAERLVDDYPEMRVHGIIGDFTRHLAEIPKGAHRLLVFLGGTIGNFRPEDATIFLRDVASTMGPHDRLLLGTDLVKEPRRIEAAYNDSKGVTAEFNLNVLSAINARLGADFDLENYDHLAPYREDVQWIEMRLRAKRSRRVSIPALDMEIGIDAGEEILTEISRKFTRASANHMVESAGLEMTDWFTDDESLFGLSLSRRR